MSNPVRVSHHDSSCDCKVNGNQILIEVTLTGSAPLFLDLNKKKKYILCAEDLIKDKQLLGAIRTQRKGSVMV